MDYRLLLYKTSRIWWIQQINQFHQSIVVSKDDNVLIDIDKSIRPSDLTPLHIVSLACFIDCIYTKASGIWIKTSQELTDFLMNDLYLQKYFNDISHIEAKSKTILNLWKIVHEESFLYRDNLSKYLKQEYFKGLDISMLGTTLDELYANVADHSKSNGVAYSYIQYNELEQTISVAFCDFGIGIPNSLKNANLHPLSNKNYIEYATKKGVTAKSNEHNAGFGLDTLKDCMQGSDNNLIIISNNEMYVYSYSQDVIIERTVDLNFNFQGTLISYTINISQFESEEIIGYGSLDENLDW